MSAKAKKYTCWTMQFCGGGASYGLLEILWRGYTHLSMLIAGGLCFWLLVRITKFNLKLSAKSVIGGLCITLVEFISGCIVNLWLGLSVWDYSDSPMSLFGQVCLGYTLIWIVLSATVVTVCGLGIDWFKYISRARFSQAQPLFRRETLYPGTAALSFPGKKRRAAIGTIAALPQAYRVYSKIL